MYPYNIDKPIKKTGEEIILCPDETADDKLAELIIMAIEDEDSDAHKYKALSDAATDEDDIEILRSIYLDECRHKKLLSEIYEELYGKMPEMPSNEFNFENTSLAQEYNKNILNEIESARFYRDLENMFTNQETKNIISSMIDDEQNHSVLNVYLFHKNQ